MSEQDPIRVLVIDDSAFSRRTIIRMLEKSPLIEVVGWADPEHYPLQKKRHSFEFLREISHLRPRTNALGGVARVRSRLSFAIHEFFHHKGFHQIHTPVITTSDCEGAGEMFQVVTEQELKDSNRRTSESESFFGGKAGLTVSRM